MMFKKLLKLGLICFIGAVIIASCDTNNVMAKSFKKQKVKITSAVVNNNGAVTLKWKKVKGAKGYLVYVGSKKVKSLKKTNFTYTKTVRGKTYTFKVKAFTKKGKKKIYSKVAKKTVKVPVKTTPKTPSKPITQDYEDIRLPEDGIPETIYVGYNSNTKTLVFTHYDKDKYLNNCDVKYGDIYNKTFTNETLPWRNVAKDVLYVNISTQIKPKNTAYWFYGVGSENLLSLNISNIHTVNVVDMSYMFYECGMLEMRNLMLGDNFDTSNVRNMSHMFEECGKCSLKTLDLKNKFDTSNVVDTSYMFNECGQSLSQIDLGEKFNTSNVKNMSNMFSLVNGNKVSSIYLGKQFDTANVENMESMFQTCSNLIEIQLFDKFDTSNVKTMDWMFADCKNISKLILGSKFNTAKVESMTGMFNNCGEIASLDLSMFNTTKVKNMDYMFTNCKNLTQINYGNNFKSGSLTSSISMFDNCPANRPSWVI